MTSWAAPAAPDPDALPTMLQLDALSAELDEIDGALATMDTRAVTSSASAASPGPAPRRMAGADPEPFGTSGPDGPGGVNPPRPWPSGSPGPAR